MGSPPCVLSAADSSCKKIQHKLCKTDGGDDGKQLAECDYSSSLKKDEWPRNASSDKYACSHIRNSVEWCRGWMASCAELKPRAPADTKSHVSCAHTHNRLNQVLTQCTKTRQVNSVVVSALPFACVVGCMRRSISDRLCFAWQVITIGDLATYSQGDLLNITSFESLLRTVPADHPPPAKLRITDNRQLVALICYSSGTTGKPKGCMQSHHSLVANGCMNK